MKRLILITVFVISILVFACDQGIIPSPESEFPTLSLDDLDGRLVFHSYTAYDVDDVSVRHLDSEIRVINMKTQEHEQNIEELINERVIHAMNARFSPDGKYITFMGLDSDIGDTDFYLSLGDGWADYLDIFIFDFQTGCISNISSISYFGSTSLGGNNQVEEDPVFGSDNTTIYFKLNRGDIWSTTLTGGTIERITDNSIESSGPVFSPDGLKMAYWLDDSSNSKIVIHYLSSGETFSLDMPDFQDYFPNFFDNNSILYSTGNRSTQESTKDDDIYLFSIGVSGLQGREGKFNHAGEDSDAFVIDSEKNIIGYSRDGDICFSIFDNSAFFKLEIGNYPDKLELGGCYTELIIQEFSYEIGDIGPAGGIIFWDKGSYSDGWRYLEAAPKGWYYGGDDPLVQWGFDNVDINGDNTSLPPEIDEKGRGDENTQAIVDFYGPGLYAAYLCYELVIDNFADWYLPAKTENYYMINTLDQNSESGIILDYYWGSTEASWSVWCCRGDGNLGSSSSNLDKTTEHYVRPIRKF